MARFRILIINYAEENGIHAFYDIMFYVNIV
jgi:hypothetical protein